MNAIRYDAPEDELEDEPEAFVLPGRPRRRLGGPATALVLAALVGAGCFYAGVRVEKGQVTTSASTGTAAGTGGVRAAAAGRGLGFGGGGFARTLAGAGNATFGTVTSVAGKSLYLTDSTGNTVKVTLSSATTITKSLPVSSRSVRPGDTLLVAGLKGSDGTISATSVTDSGARGAGAGGGLGAGLGGGSGSGGAGGSGGGTSSGNAAVNSLFGSGGG